MRFIVFTLAVTLLASCSFSPTDDDLKGRLNDFSIDLNLSDADVLLAKGQDFGPQSGHDICYVVEIEDRDFVALTEHVASIGKNGTSFVYEQNRVCQFKKMRDIYGVSQMSNAFSFNNADGVNLDVMYNEDRRIVLFFFWQT